MIDKKYVLENIYSDYKHIKKEVIKNIFEIALSKVNLLNDKKIILNSTIVDYNPILVTKEIIENNMYNIIKLPKYIDGYKGYFLNRFMPNLFDISSNCPYVNRVILKELEENMKMDYFIDNIKQNGLIVELIERKEYIDEYIVVTFFSKYINNDEEFLPFDDKKIEKAFEVQASEDLGC